MPSVFHCGQLAFSASVVQLCVLEKFMRVFFFSSSFIQWRCTELWNGFMPIQQPTTTSRTKKRLCFFFFLLFSSSSSCIRAARRRTKQKIIVLHIKGKSLAFFLSRQIKDKKKEIRGKKDDYETMANMLHIR